MGLAPIGQFIFYDIYISILGKVTNDVVWFRGCMLSIRGLDRGICSKVSIYMHIWAIITVMFLITTVLCYVD